MRRSAMTDVFLVCTAVASATWVALELRHPSGVDLGERQGMLLRAFRTEDVKRLMIERPGAPQLTVGRASEGSSTRFTLEGPEPEPAADEAIDAWLSALRLAAPRRRVSQVANASPALHIEKPIASLAIDLGAISYRVVRGSPVPGNEELVYIGVSGDGVPDSGVAVLATAAADQLFPTREALLSRQLLPAAPSEWRALELGTEAARLRLERSSVASGWRIGEPPTRVSRDAIRRIEVALVRLEARPRLSPENARAALGKASLELTVEATTEAGPWRFELGGQCPEGDGIVAFRLAPSVRAGCVPREIIEALPATAAEVVDSTLFDASFDEIERIVISDGPAKLELVRDELGFRLLSPATESVALERGNEFLKRLGAVQGELVAPLREVGAPKWAGAIRIVLSGAEEGAPRQETLRLGPMQRDGRRELLREQDGRRLFLARAQAALVSADATQLLPTEVFAVSSRELRQLSLSEGTLHEVIARDEKGIFTLIEPLGFEIDQAAAERLFDAACGLRARRRVSSSEVGALNFGSMPLKLELTSAVKGAVRNVLEIGARGRDGHLARSSPGDRLFLLAPESVDALRELVLRQSAWSCGPRELLRVHVTLPESSFVLESDGSGFVSTPVPSAHDDALTSALVSLAPLGVVHFGAPLAHEGARAPVLVLEREARTNAPACCRKRIVIGTADAWRERAVHYAWLEGLDAVFALPRSSIQALLGREGSIPSEAGGLDGSY